MKTYSNNLEYQGLQTALEQSKAIFETLKAEKKEAEAALKALKKEGKASNVDIHLLKFQLQQAKLKGKSEKLNAELSKFQLKEWITQFKKKHKEEAVKEKSPLRKRKKAVRKPIVEADSSQTQEAVNYTPEIVDQKSSKPKLKR